MINNLLIIIFKILLFYSIWKLSIYGIEIIVKGYYNKNFSINYASFILHIIIYGFSLILFVFLKAFAGKEDIFLFVVVDTFILIVLIFKYIKKIKFIKFNFLILFLTFVISFFYYLLSHETGDLKIMVFRIVNTVLIGILFYGSLYKKYMKLKAL